MHGSGVGMTRCTAIRKDAPPPKNRPVLRSMVVSCSEDRPVAFLLIYAAREAALRLIAPPSDDLIAKASEVTRYFAAVASISTMSSGNANRAMPSNVMGGCTPALASRPTISP